jgi:hypothetical protein
MEATDGDRYITCDLCNNVGLDTMHIDSHRPTTILCSNNICNTTWTVCCPCKRKISVKNWTRHCLTSRHSVLSFVPGSVQEAGLFNDTEPDGDDPPPPDDQSVDDQLFFPEQDMAGSTGTLDTTSNDKIGVDTNCGLTQTGPPSSNEGVNQAATLSGQEWMLSIQGPRSTEQVGEDTLNEVFGKDSVSPPLLSLRVNQPWIWCTLSGGISF